MGTDHTLKHFRAPWRCWKVLYKCSPDTNQSLTGHESVPFLLLGINLSHNLMIINFTFINTHPQSALALTALSPVSTFYHRMRKLHWQTVKKWCMKEVFVTSSWSTKLGRTTSRWSSSLWFRPADNLTARSSWSCWRRFQPPWRSCTLRVRGLCKRRAMARHLAFIS